MVGNQDARDFNAASAMSGGGKTFFRLSSAILAAGAAGPGRTFDMLDSGAAGFRPCSFRSQTLHSHPVNTITWYTYSEIILNEA